MGTWNQDIPVDGSVPVAYLPHVESVTPDNLADWLTSKGVDVSNGEADPFAAMSISMKDKKIK